MNKAYAKIPEMGKILPSLELLERSLSLLEETVSQMGKLTLETVLAMSAIELAGEPQRGKARGDIKHHGSQGGFARIQGKRAKIDRPRLRGKDGKEVEIPAYKILKTDPNSAERALQRVLKGVSMREYQGVFDEAGKELGLSKSNISRQVKMASEKALKELFERKISSRQIIILADGIRVGESLILCSIGIGESGEKTLLGIHEGATENSVAVGTLLDSMIARGLDSGRPILFIIDGAKALRSAILARFSRPQIQRCRVHKIRNVLAHLPESKRSFVKAKLNLAYGLPYPESLTRFESLAKELETSHPGAAGSLREGLVETLTVSRLKLSPLLISSLASTNLIESSYSRARARLRKVTNYSTESMSLRWAASAMLVAEQTFRTLKGCKDYGCLKPHSTIHLTRKRCRIMNNKRTPLQGCN